MNALVRYTAKPVQHAVMYQSFTFQSAVKLSTVTKMNRKESKMIKSKKKDLSIKLGYQHEKNILMHQYLSSYQHVPEIEKYEIIRIR